jgi:hypothetical protein
MDHFATQPFYWGGQTIQLTETQEHLYLHVYAELGNHVGLNYVTNETELEIPGAFYFDDMNGTITISLPTTDQMKIVVDAAYAKEPVEYYNVTVALKNDQGTSTLTYSNSINAEETQIVQESLPLIPEGSTAVLLSALMVLTLILVIVNKQKKLQ